MKNINRLIIGVIGLFFACEALSAEVIYWGSYPTHKVRVDENTVKVLPTLPVDDDFRKHAWGALFHWNQESTAFPEPDESPLFPAIREDIYRHRHDFARLLEDMILRTEARAVEVYFFTMHSMVLMGVPRQDLVEMIHRLWNKAPQQISGYAGNVQGACRFISHFGEEKDFPLLLEFFAKHPEIIVLQGHTTGDVNLMANRFPEAAKRLGIIFRPDGMLHPFIHRKEPLSAEEYHAALLELDGRLPPYLRLSSAIHPKDAGEIEGTIPKAAERQPKPGEEPNSTPWSIITVLIVAATGLLWLLVKKRK